MTGKAEYDAAAARVKADPVGASATDKALAAKAATQTSFMTPVAQSGRDAMNAVAKANKK